jgi:hypothetical protein
MKTLARPMGCVAVMLYGMVVSMSQQARADDSLTDIQKHVETLRSQQAGASGREAKRIFNRARAEAEAVGAQLERAKPETPAPSSSEIARTHVRGSDGVPFPKPEEVVFEPSPPPVIKPSTGMSPKVEDREFRKPPRCESPQTIRDVWPLDEEKEERIIGDVLYLPEHLMPVDPMEVFGSKVRVFTYGPTSGNGVDIRMTIDAVPCVPYRIRVTNHARYYHKGDRALRNYDKRLNGEGNYHSWIQQKVFLGK